MPSIARPQKVYDFTAHARRQPTAPPPGDRIDAQLSNHADAIVAVQLAVEQLIAAQTRPLDVEGPARAVLAQAERAAQEIRRTSGDAAAIVDQAKLELKRVWAEADRARGAADRAEARLAAAVLDAQASPALQFSNAPASQAMPALGYGAGGFYAGDDAGAAAVSADYAQVAIEWAEHLPDTIPPNILAINAISGEHWSSRWWALRAANAFGMLAWWYMGAWPGPPPTTPLTSTGQPIPPGAMYFDTVLGMMLVWNGSSWVPLTQGPAKATTASLYYLSVAGQTVFPLGVADRFGHVFAFNQAAPEGLLAHVNGVRLEPVYDYSVDTAASSVAFLRGLSVNSIVAFDLLTPTAQLAPSGSVNTVLAAPIAPDGVKTHFAGLTVAASGKPLSVAKNEELLVSVNGVQQSPGASYNAAADTIDFVQAPEADANIFITWFGPSTGGGGGLPPPTAPVNTASPVVTGAATAGSTLTLVSQGAWTNALSFVYQWQRNGAPIFGAAASTYLLTSADSSTVVNCVVTATNSGGSASATSNAIAVLPTAPVNSVPPTISGTASIGSTLTLTSSGTWSGGPTLATQWLRDNVNIAGATASTYVVVSADAGRAISAAVTATNAAGSASAGSNALAVPLFPGSPVGIFSVRKVGTGYAGPCLRVIRSDNTQTDIGFNPATGLIDMAAANAFAAGSILFVTKWYDQSGGGLDVSQANPGIQPQLSTINGKPWISFTAGGGGSALIASTLGGAGLPGDQTIGVVGQLNSDNGQMPVGCTDDAHGWGFFYNGVAAGPGPNPGKNVYWTPGGSVVGTFDMLGKMPTRMCVTRASGAVKIYANGALGGSGSGISNSAPTTAGAFLQIGSYYFHGMGFEGLIGEVFVYASALTDPVRLGIDANQALTFPDTGFLPPYNGASAVQFGLSENVAFGNILNYERTQAWTAWGAIQMYGVSPLAIAGGIVFSNVTAPSDLAFPGYEMWVDNGGFMRVRLIHDAAATPFPNMVGRAGSIYLADGKPHMLCATYDGSSSVNGIKLYVDGVLDTGSRDEGYTLTASIIKTGQAMFVGTQQGEGAFNFTGTIGHVQLDNIVRSAATIAPVKNGVLPPKDAATVWRLAFTEGNGTTVADTSGGAHNGTLTSGNMWVP